nr:hypothetical protein [Kibdelosporangium sp. MJ126-NF4]CTQ94531.1 hypothetical protein [Kibdelosporangium sp. MJ126-NF4]
MCVVVMAGQVELSHCWSSLLDAATWKLHQIAAWLFEHRHEP